MTDTNPALDPAGGVVEPGEGGTGVKRPDQTGDTPPGKDPAAPASGGEGAPGAGGPDGFGTGT